MYHKKEGYENVNWLWLRTNSGLWYYEH